MGIDVHNLEVKNNRDANRYEVQLGDQLGTLTYRIRGNVITFIHTEIPADYRGQGIAERMAHVALEAARAEGSQVKPLCPFVRAYIRRHAEYQSLVVELPEP